MVVVVVACCYQSMKVEAERVQLQDLRAAEVDRYCVQGETGCVYRSATGLFEESSCTG